MGVDQGDLACRVGSRRLRGARTLHPGDCRTGIVDLVAPVEARQRQIDEARRCLEDEAPVRRIMCQILRRQGYTILEAESAIAALPIWEKHRDQIDLLLTDILMPGGMNGQELARRDPRP